MNFTLERSVPRCARASDGDAGNRLDFYSSVGQRKHSADCARASVALCTRLLSRTKIGAILVTSLRLHSRSPGTPAAQDDKRGEKLAWVPYGSREGPFHPAILPFFHPSILPYFHTSILPSFHSDHASRPRGFCACAYAPWLAKLRTYYTTSYIAYS